MTIMKTISIFGLGYVGCVSAACFAKLGYRVIGVEIKKTKVDLINSGNATVVEPYLDELLKSGVQKKLISATTEASAAITQSDIVLVTVGTPSLVNGELDLKNIFSVAEQFATILRNIERHLTFVIRSTIQPGTCGEIEKLIEAVSGKKKNIDFSVVSNPEFLREGSAIKDFEKPPYIIIGSKSHLGFEETKTIYAGLDAEVINVTVETAEMLKFVNNTWHALKVSFGNEIGSICKKVGVNSYELIDLFARDKSLNISSNYLWPGFAYGGSCLPKDLNALEKLAESNGVIAPLIQSISKSNEEHIFRAAALLKLNSKNNVIGFLGVSFKNGTDDLRNSPTLKLIKLIRNDGYQIVIFDKDVNESIFNGKDLSTIKSLLGPIEGLLLQNLSELAEKADLIVITKNDKKQIKELKRYNPKRVIDFVHVKDIDDCCDYYEGIAW